MKKKTSAKKTFLNLYVNIELKEKLRRKAEFNGRSVSRQAVRILEQNLEVEI